MKAPASRDRRRWFALFAIFSLKGIIILMQEAPRTEAVPMTRH